MATQPWAHQPPAPVPYESAYSSIEGAGWEAFQRFYLRRRGTKAQVLSKMLKAATGLSVAERQAVLAELRKSRTAKDLLGQLGEIIGSFVLEHYHGVLLFGMTWPIQPFEVRRGTDISGVCLESWLVLFAESKAASRSSVATQVRKAREALKASRLFARFRLDLADGQSRRSAVRAVRLAISTRAVNLGAVTPDQVEQLVNADSFARVGVILHERTTQRFDYSGALSALENDDLAQHQVKATARAQRAASRRLPTVFLDVAVDTLADAMDAWIGLEEASREG